MINYFVSALYHLTVGFIISLVVVAGATEVHLQHKQGSNEQYSQRHFGADHQLDTITSAAGFVIY
jgi:hypothetical protein